MLFSASNPKGDDDQDWYSITMADPTWWCGSMLGPVSGHSSLSAVNCPIMKIMVIIITATTSAVIMMMKLGLVHTGFLNGVLTSCQNIWQKAEEVKKNSQ